VTRELVGDSSREGKWAFVRLEVDGQRIVGADAPGIDGELVGATLLEAAAIGGDLLAVDALANAIGAAIRTPGAPGRTAVAMSGGVDSAVALLHAGENAVGVTLRLWIDPGAAASERVCCSPAAVIAARQTCHALGIPHVTLDLRERFRSAVVEPFTLGYARGETPNPCSRCNGAFRFDELLRFTRRAGAERLATGHYARLVERDGALAIARAADATKDQSYMLATLDPATLARLSFPLGAQTKEETREQAQAAGLAVAGRRDSQEACFLGGDDYRAFLARRGLEQTPGPIVDEDGRRVGTHEGFWRYTPGQRRGLGVAADQPLYALSTEAATNTVVVGPRSSLGRVRVGVRGRLDRDTRRVQAKLRHRSPAVMASVERSARGFELILDEPFYGVAPGQTAVLYENDAVVGAGTIVAAA
jgi:tRNA-uridine 2-sulfurtransferase